MTPTNRLTEALCEEELRASEELETSVIVGKKQSDYYSINWKKHCDGGDDSLCFEAAFLILKKGNLFK